MNCLDDITVLVINYRTLELTQHCVESFRTYYPQVKVILIDNGSFDDSRNYIQELAESQTHIFSLLNPRNIFHGPAIHKGIQTCQTPLVMTLDSDVQVMRGGFLEDMAGTFEQPGIYAIGKLVHMDMFGYETTQDTLLTFEYIHPSCMLVRREVYLKLNPFFHHGSPGIRNMRHAIRSGYKLVDFPIEKYIQHNGRGTCSRYGYGLGMRHTIEYLLHNVLKALYHRQ